MNSGEIDRALGAAIQQATGVRVDLEQPELTVFVEVLARPHPLFVRALPGRRAASRSAPRGA